jgi:Kef-type K+ transport system membrane component KefB
LANFTVRSIVATRVVDDVLTMIVFSFVLAFLNDDAVGITHLRVVMGKVILFFTVPLGIGLFLYPRFTFLFRSVQGKGFTFIR